MSDSNERWSLQYDHLNSQLRSIDRKAERTAENHEKLREKVQTIENKIFVALGIAAALAAIFGIAGAVGYYILLGAQEKISQLRKDVEIVHERLAKARSEIDKEVEQANIRITAQGSAVITQIQNTEARASRQLQDVQTELAKNVTDSTRTLDGYIEKTISDLTSIKNSNISEIRAALQQAQQQLIEDFKSKKQQIETMSLSTVSAFEFNELSVSGSHREILARSDIGPFVNDAIAMVTGTITQDYLQGNIDLNVRLRIGSLESARVLTAGLLYLERLWHHFIA